VPVGTYVVQPVGCPVDGLRSRLDWTGRVSLPCLVDFGGSSPADSAFVDSSPRQVIGRGTRRMTLPRSVEVSTRRAGDGHVRGRRYRWELGLPHAPPSP
jgi:hypothetical protein